MRAALLARGAARAGGVGRLISGVISGLPGAARPEDCFLAITDAPLPEELRFPALEETVAGTSQPAIFDHFIVPRRARKWGADVFLATKNSLPPGLPCPSACIYLDLAYFALPSSYPPLDNLYMRAMFRRSARAARRIIAISESTRRDVGRFLSKEAMEKTRVVYPGIDERFRPFDGEELAAARQRFSDLPERFVLYAGDISPRKNLRRLLDAFSGLPREVGLVVTGHRAWKSAHVERALRAAALRREIFLLGGVPEGDLPALYNLAEASVYPSLYEGFGFPVLESMACGTPVAASNASSIPEAAGDAALLFDPHDPGAIREALSRLLEDPGLRERLSEKGRERASAFTWQRCAGMILELLREIV